jgi:hypothetical protein
MLAWTHIFLGKATESLCGTKRFKNVPLGDDGTEMCHKCHWNAHTFHMKPDHEAYRASKKT